MNYWLLKSDPEEFSWEDLKTSKNRTTHWDGVRNYQARNNLKKMKEGDLAFFYHSVVNPQVITGIVKVVREAYPDYTQFDPNSDHYDPKSHEENPRWFMVDIKLESSFNVPVTRDELKTLSGLEEMELFRNTRLSVQPVSPKEWDIILSFQEEKSKNTE